MPSHCFRRSHLRKTESERVGLKHRLQWTSRDMSQLSIRVTGVINLPRRPITLHATDTEPYRLRQPIRQFNLHYVNVTSGSDESSES